MAGSLTGVGKELAKNNLDFVGVQEMGWNMDTCVTDPADDIAFLYGNGHDNHDLGTGFFVHKGIISSLEVGVWSRMPFIMLRDYWCDIIVLNMHAPTG
jgi:hypothetical protein